jgi:hypothetical protein
MIIIYGTRMYGRIDKFAGQCIATRFFHLYYLPLIPLSSWLVLGSAEDGQERVIDIGLSGRSLGIAYLRIYGVIAAAVAGALCFGAFTGASSLEAAELVPMVVVAAAAAALATLAWVRLGQLSQEAKAQRAVYYDHTGLFTDPALLPKEVRGPVQERLKSLLAARAEATDVGPRLLDSPEEPRWIAMARSATFTDTEAVKAALTLSRLECSQARGAERQRLESAHQAIWERVKALDPDVLHIDRYGI